MDEHGDRDRFALTESTVKKHVGSMLAKTGARDRVQAVIIAYDSGLVAPSRRRVGAARGLRQCPVAAGMNLKPASCRSTRP